MTRDGISLYFPEITRWPTRFLLTIQNFIAYVIFLFFIIWQISSNFYPN